jgi:hypothetical protein
VDGNSCQACPAETTKPAGDDASGGDTKCTCVAAPAPPPPPSTDCVCAADHSVVSGACTPCPASQVRPRGDDPGSGDTSCAHPCDASEPVVGHAMNYLAGHTVAADACDGTAAGAACAGHTIVCKADHEGGSITCNADGTYTVPLLRTPAFSLSLCKNALPSLVSVESSHCKRARVGRWRHVRASAARRTSLLLAQRPSRLTPCTTSRAAALRARPARSTPPGTTPTAQRPPADLTAPRR